MTNLSIAADEEEASEDEESGSKLTLAERQAKTAKEREEKQRKYEERREQLFGSNQTNNSNTTPPSSRSGTPSRGRGGKYRNGSRPSSAISLNAKDPKKELFDPSSSPRPNSSQPTKDDTSKANHPIRQPRGPDPNGGFGFNTTGERSSG